MATVRVKAGIASVVSMPDGTWATLKEDMAFDSSDPVVAVAPWAFESDDDARPRRGRPTSARIEQATVGGLR